MTLKIPKELAGFSYPPVFPVDVRDFDIDLLLQRLFFRAASDGNDRARQANDPAAIATYVDRLARHPHVAGFATDPAAHRLLDRLVRTSLVYVIRKGAARQAAQIGGITEYSYLAFKPGYPYSDRLRGVDALVYRLLRDQLGGEDAVRAFLEAIFGKGLTLQRGVEPSGAYDGRTNLDTLTRLSLAFLDGFEATGIRYARTVPPRPLCPAYADRMARDLVRFLTAYRPWMPTEALTYHFKALVNLEIFRYAQTLFQAVVALAADPEQVPSAMGEAFVLAPPLVYLDWTDGRETESRAMAAACVRQDLELLHAFARANLTLRLLDRYANRLRRDSYRHGALVTEALAGRRDGAAYLQALLRLPDHPVIGARIEAAAMHDEDLILTANRGGGTDDGDGVERDTACFDDIAAVAESAIERVVLLLLEGQRTRLATNNSLWLRSAAGFGTPYGLLAGTLKSRQSWRYAPGNDLLATLVQLAAVDIPDWNPADPRPRPIALRDFLAWLEERFGVLVARPPSGFAGPPAMSAAQENLRAMLRRLRQMGFFRDLSDDFTVQRLLPPYGSEASSQGKVAVNA